MRQPAPLSVFRLSGDDRLLLSRFFVRRSGGAECQSAKNACRAQSAERDVPVAFGPHRLRRTGGNGATCFGRMCGIACRVMPVVRRRPHAGPAPLSVFRLSGAAARISPQARAFPPRCRTAGPCAFLSEGRSGRSLRNAPRGRDLGRRMNRGPHGSEEPRSAAAFRNRPDSLSGRQTIPTGPLRNDSERLSKRSCETPKQNPGCTESPRHKPVPPAERRRSIVPPNGKTAPFGLLSITFCRKLSSDANNLTINFYICVTNSKPKPKTQAWTKPMYKSYRTS